MRLLRRLNEERSQLIIMFVGIFSIVMIIGAITIDFGLWFVERQGVERAADLAALAGSQSLLRHANRTDLDPNGNLWWKVDEAQAIKDACTWAGRNGYDPNATGGGATVDVHLSCTGKGAGLVGICQSKQDYCSISYPHPRPCPLPGLEDPINWSTLDEEGCDSISVTINKSTTQLFSSFFNVPGSQVGFASAAGETTQATPLDVVLVIDQTISMATETTHGHSRLYWAEQAALVFVNELAGGASSPSLGSNNVEVITFAGSSFHVVTPFSSDAGAVRAAINAIGPNSYGDGSTYIAPALTKATSDLNAHVHPNSYHVVVLLSDGRNYALGDPMSGTNCQATHQRRTDTVNAIPGLRAAAKDVFTVGVGNLYGLSNGCDPYELDEDLLKQIAYGPHGYYMNVLDAWNLPQIFQGLAWAISGRSLIQ